MGEKSIVASNFMMKITTFKKVNKDDENYTLVKANEVYTRERGKNFNQSLYEERAKGINHPIEVVCAAPQEFIPNTIYVRQDGKFVWVFRVEEDAEV